MKLLVIGLTLCQAYMAPLSPGIRVSSNWQPRFMYQPRPLHSPRLGSLVVKMAASNGPPKPPPLVAQLLERQPKMKKVYRKLVTREDRFSTHKVLGSFCVIHAAFRLANTGPAAMGCKR